MIVGNSIGAGIMRTPGDVAAWLPSPGLFLAAWIAGGVYALLGAASLAELGVMIPKSGGQYVFAHHTFGPYAGFVIGWSDWISSCASGAAVSIVVGEYVSFLAPTTMGRASITAVAVMIFFTLLQWRGIRWGDRTQQFTSLLKALAFAALIIACFILPPMGPKPEATSIARAAPSIAAVVLAMQAVIYTYDGWNGVLYFSEEVRDPAHDIPRSMLGGVASVTLIYVLVNVAFLYVLGIAGMAGSNFAAGAAAQALFGPRGDTVIRVMMVVSMLSSVNAILLLSSRVPFAMSRDGLFPAAAARVNVGGTPTVTLLASSLLTIGFIVTGTFAIAAGIAAFFFVLQYVASFAAVFVLRRREPDRPRAYRAIGYPWTTGIVFVGGVAFLIGAIVQDRRNSMIAIALLVGSWPLYQVIKRFMRPRSASGEP